MAIKKNLPFLTTRMDLEGIMLRELSQTAKDKYCTNSLIRGIREQSPKKPKFMPKREFPNANQRSAKRKYRVFSLLEDIIMNQNP